MRGIVAAVLWSIVCGSVVASAAERADVSPSEERDLGSGHSFMSGIDGAAAFRVGDKAPAFSAIDLQGRWIPFRSLVGRRPVLLLFGAAAADLGALDHARTVFADMDVDAVAVLDRRSGSNARWLERVGYRGHAISDPSGAIGVLYGCLDAATRRHVPAWFLIDEHGAVRGFERGTLPGPPELVGFAARELRRPLPPSAAGLVQRISMASP